MNEMALIILCGLIIIIINTAYNNSKPNKNRTEYLTCHTGDFRGQTHDMKDWRKIAIELAKSTKNSRLNAMAKYGTDEDVIGMLYLNFGVELFDETD